MMLFVHAFIIEGTNAMSMMSGTHAMSQTLNLPEYRHMHREATAKMTRMATKGDAVRVRMKDNMAMPTRNMSQPVRPSLYSMNMNPTYTRADPVSL